MTSGFIGAQRQRDKPYSSVPLFRKDLSVKRLETPDSDYSSQQFEVFASEFWLTPSVASIRNNSVWNPMSLFQKVLRLFCEDELARN
jgi:hypothetical protein